MLGQPILGTPCWFVDFRRINRSLVILSFHSFYISPSHFPQLLFYSERGQKINNLQPILSIMFWSKVIPSSTHSGHNNPNNNDCYSTHFNSICMYIYSSLVSLVWIVCIKSFAFVIVSCSLLLFFPGKVGDVSCIGCLYWWLTTVYRYIVYRM